MKSATFKATVYGDDYDELVTKAEQEICSLLVIEEDDENNKTNYELIITRDEDLNADFDYKAELIARIKYGT
jgi:hypothetical protein